MKFVRDEDICRVVPGMAADNDSQASSSAITTALLLVNLDHEDLELSLFCLRVLSVQVSKRIETGEPMNRVAIVSASPQRKLISALYSTPLVREAGVSCGVFVSEKMARRWLHENRHQDVTSVALAASA